MVKKKAIRLVLCANKNLNFEFAPNIKIFYLHLYGILFYSKSLPYKSALRNIKKNQGGKVWVPPKNEEILLFNILGGLWPMTSFPPPPLNVLAIRKGKIKYIIILKRKILEKQIS